MKGHKGINLPIESLGWLMIAALASTIRWIHLLEVSKTPYTHPAFVVDSIAYLQIAERLLQGHWQDPSAAFLQPGYPVFIGLAQICFGKTLAGILAAQIVLDALTAVICGKIAFFLTQKKWLGFLAGIAYACYGQAIFYSAVLLDVTLLTALVTLALWQAIAWEKNTSPFHAITAALAAGSATLLKPFVAPILIFFIARVWIKRTNGRVFAGVGCVLVLIALFLPFAIRNHFTVHQWTPYAQHSGLNFYIGNNPLATGGPTGIEGVEDLPITGAMQTSRTHWFKKSADFIVDEPGAWLRLCAKKLSLFWNKYELWDNVSYELSSRQIPFYRYPWVRIEWVLPLAFLGLGLTAFALNRSITFYVAAFVASQMLAVIAFYVSDRFRIPLAPSLIALSAYAVGSAIEQFRRPKIPQIFLMAALLAGGYWMSQARLFGVPGVSHAEQLRYQEALFHTNLGIFYEGRQQFDLAKGEYVSALRMYPGETRASSRFKRLLETHRTPSGI